jgi:hypothetical protein
MHDASRARLVSTSPSGAGSFAALTGLHRTADPFITSAVLAGKRGERADARIRTADPFITSEVLYQLSYVGLGAAF